MQSHRPLNSRPIDKFKSLRRKKTGGSFSAIPFCIIPSGDPAATRHHVQRNFSEQGRPVQGPKFQGASPLGHYAISWLAGPIDRRRRVVSFFLSFSLKKKMRPPRLKLFRSRRSIFDRPNSHSPSTRWSFGPESLTPDGGLAAVPDRWPDTAPAHTADFVRDLHP